MSYIDYSELIKSKKNVISSERWTVETLLVKEVIL